MSTPVFFISWTLVILALVALLVITWLMFAYFADRRRWRHRLATFSRVIQTRCGPIEVAEFGTGQPILVVHGGMGGADQTASLVEIFSPERWRFLCVSRPGYLQTPLSSGETVAEQAALLAALLDALQIQRIPVLGLSLGVRCVFRLAQLFPDRCSAIVLVGALFQEWPKISAKNERAAAALYRLRHPDFVGWLAHRFALKQVISQTGVSPPLWREASRDPVRLRLIQDLMTLRNLSQRLVGMKNDDDAKPEVVAMTLDGIRQPLLLVHAENDTFAPISEARRIAQTIPGARLHATPDGGHVVIATLHEQLVPLIEEFLLSHTGDPGSD